MSGGVPDDERMTLLLGDGSAAVANANWLSYEVDSNLLTPADAWSLTLAFAQSRLPAAARSGQWLRLQMGADVVMSGRIDDVDSLASRSASPVTIKGRDVIGQLLDCSAPIFGEQRLAFKDVVAKLVMPFGVKVAPPQGNPPMREKIIIQPGESAWDALRHAAESVGLWPWAEPDGTVVVGGPDYSAPAVAMLIHRIERPEQNNCLSVRVAESIARSYSEVTVLGQAHGGGDALKASNIKGSYTDPSVTIYRPKVVVDHQVETKAQAAERAHKLAMDARLERWTATVPVRGHRINCPGWPGHGKPWAAGMRVHLVDETHRLDGIYYVIGRRFSGGAGRQRLTTLTLKEDKAWIVAHHAHTKRARRMEGDGKIVDATHGADPVTQQ